MSFFHLKISMPQNVRNKWKTKKSHVASLSLTGLGWSCLYFIFFHYRSDLTLFTNRDHLGDNPARWVRQPQVTEICAVISPSLVSKEQLEECHCLHLSHEPSFTVNKARDETRQRGGDRVEQWSGDLGAPARNMMLVESNSREKLGFEFYFSISLYQHCTTVNSSTGWKLMGIYNVLLLGMCCKYSMETTERKPLYFVTYCLVEANGYYDTKYVKSTGDNVNEQIQWSWGRRRLGMVKWKPRSPTWLQKGKWVWGDTNFWILLDSTDGASAPICVHCSVS